MNKADCPIWKQTKHVVGDAQALTASLRKLRRSMRKCSECQDYDNCPILKNFNVQFDIALQEVIDEWGLHT